MKNYYYQFVYPAHRQPASVRQTLQDLLVPRKWQHFLRIEQQIKINGTYRHFNQLVYPQERVSLKLTHVSSNQQQYPASGQLPQVLYEDKDVLVINKPAGQKTHPNLFEKNTALNDCATYLGFSPYIVHRLDMLTQGCLLVAKNPAVVPILNRELTNKSFQRLYLAEVNLTQPLPAAGTISLPIGRDPDDQRKRMVRFDGRPAKTSFQVIKRTDQAAWLKLQLKTGRTHQIRVHLAAQGWPIIGDPLYNPDFQKGESLQLKAYALSFIRPFSFQRRLVESTQKGSF